jgi:hypothetical protein
MRKAGVQKGPSRQSRSCELHPQVPRLIKPGDRAFRDLFPVLLDLLSTTTHALLRSAPTLESHVGGSDEG